MVQRLAERRLVKKRHESATKEKHISQPAKSTKPKTAQVMGKDTSEESFSVVGIGASAGGLEAFTQLLRELPSDTNVALVLVQHLDPTYKSMLTELLSRTTKLAVLEVTDGVRVKPRHV